jgi:hypothetical protein
VITLRRGNTSGKVVIQPASGETVEGWSAPTQKLDGRNEYITLASDGTTWFVIAMDAK